MPGFFHVRQNKFALTHEPNFFETYHQKDLTTSKIQDVRKAIATEIPLSERECSPNK